LRGQATRKDDPGQPDGTEGASINRPPLFCGVNYQFWKVRMKIFMHSTDKGIWETIENGPFIPQVKRDEVLIDKP